MKRTLAVTALLLVSAPASAQRFKLEPQNRIHAGLSVVNSSFDLGASAGFDTRLSQALYVDIGGFMTPGDDSVRPELSDVANASEYFELRHGVYVAPGLRVPHRYGDGLNWDVMGRLGFGGVWSVDGSNAWDTNADPALLAGLDVFLMYKVVGLRLSSKGYLYEGYAAGVSDDTVVFRPQTSVEAVFEW